MAVLLSGTTIGGHAAVHANNISTYALTSVPSNVITTSGGQTIAGITYFSNGESLNLYGIRGRFTDEYIHLYNKVGIGHPGGWGEGRVNTGVYGLSTYGGINIAYGYDGGATINTYTRINKNWAGGDYSAEQFTIRGTYPSIALRSTQHNSKWLIHHASELQFYYGGTVDDNNWANKFSIPTDGNIWMAWANANISTLLAAKASSSHTHDDRYFTESESDGRFFFAQSSQLANTNLNDLTTRGVYYSGDQYGTNTNIPFDNYFTMINLTNEGSRQAQLWFGDTPGNAYWRPRQGDSVWHPWEKLITSNNIGNQSVSYATSAGNATTANGANGNFYIDDNYGNSIVGLYASTRYQGVFAMGDSYKLPADGTSTGSLYGLAWSHPNAGGVAANLNTHGLLVVENGTFLAAISGSIRARDDMRAPIFYDSQDTTYYLDPNSSVSGIFAGSVGINNTSPINTAWGNATTTKQLSINATNYAVINLLGGSRRFSMGVGDNIFYMCYDNTAGRHNIQVNSSGSVTIPVDVRSSIFYDSEDTGFFVDPNSESKLYRLNVGGSNHSLENTEAVLKFRNTVNQHNYIVSNASGWNSWSQWVRYVEDYNTWRIGTYDENPESGTSVWRLAGRNRPGNGEINYIVAGPRGAWGDSDRVVLWNPYARYDGGSWNGDGTHYQVITAANIGSQSVSYASSAGNADTLEGFSAYELVTEARGVHSGSDFVNGTLVTTDINANGWAGDSFIMEVSGKSYGSGTPFKLIMEGYLYADTIINVSAMSYGYYFPGPVKVMRYNGNIAFWWPRGSYWNSFEVHVRSANGDSWNRVTGINDSVDPASADKKISITPTQVIHSGNIASQSVSYAVTSGTSSATTQTNFAELFIENVAVATKEFVTSQGYLTSLPSHNHDDRYYTETEVNNITHQWQWRWIRWATFLGPAGPSAAQWTDYYKTYFTERSTSTEASYGEQDSGYVNTITNVDSDGGFGGSSYGNIFGNLESYHCLIYTNIYVDKAFTVSVGNFNGDDPHAIFIDGVFVHGNTSCCVDTSYSYTFTQGWHRIDLIYAEGGGGDWIRMGWNPKDYTANIKDMTPHRAGENPRNILDKIKNLVVQSDQSVRAPIFYDSENTAYYVDPNGNSKLVNLGLGGATPDARLSVSGDIHMDGYIYQGGTAGVINSWGSRTYVNSGNYVSNARSFRFDNLGYGSTWALDINSSGNVIASVDMRAPIFYDSNDANYYIDPNGYSQTSSIYANNWFRAQSNTGLYFSSYSRGIWAADSAGSSYGNVSIYGDGINSWPGYAINNSAIFMARDTRRGIFIPSADSWLIRYESGDGMAYVDFELQWGSDIRHKSNIKRISGALDKVKQLKGVTYNYKGNERTSIGFIAQEVEPVLPEVVSTDNDGFKSVGYANIVALLSEAIKEQQVMIEELRAEIDALKSK